MCYPLKIFYFTFDFDDLSSVLRLGHVSVGSPT